MAQDNPETTYVLHGRQVWVDIAVSLVTAAIAAIHRAVHLEIFMTTLMVLPSNLSWTAVTISQSLQKFCHELPLGHLRAPCEVWL